MTKRRRRLGSVALSLLLVGAATVCASAEVRLSGTTDDLALWAREATLAEILSGIHSTFGAPITLTGSTARRFTGSYTGSLHHVLSRLLDGENYTIGWSPAGMRIAILGHRLGQPAPTSAVDLVASNSVQGWLPEASPPPLAVSPAPPANAAQPLQLAANDDEPSSPIQGWMDSAKPFVKPAAAAPAAAPAPANAVDPVGSQSPDTAKPQAEDTEEHSAVQGWEPAGNPFKDVPIRRAPIATDTTAASAQDEGNPNFQGYTPDWTPPAPGESAIGGMPILSAPALGLHR
jgi:hypothetical protein